MPLAYDSRQVFFSSTRYHPKAFHYVTGWGSCFAVCVSRAQSASAKMSNESVHFQPASEVQTQPCVLVLSSSIGQLAAIVAHFSLPSPWLTASVAESDAALLKPGALHLCPRPDIVAVTLFWSHSRHHISQQRIILNLTNVGLIDFLKTRWSDRSS